MYAIDFEYNEMKIHMEHFNSMLDLMEDISHREYVNTCLSDRMRWCVEGENGGKLGNLCRNGYKDEEIIKNLRLYTGSVQTIKKDVYRRKYLDVVGGAVDIQAYLTGTPLCMRNLKKKTVKQRVFNVVIHVEATADITTKEYCQAGEVLAKKIISIEKAGYGVNLMATDAYYSDDADAICVMGIDIKHSGSGANYPRLLFPMVCREFMSGVGFGWLARTKEYGGSSYGTYVENCVGKGGLMSILSRIVKNEDSVVFTIRDMVRMLRQSGTKGLSEYIEAKIIDLEE